MVTEPTDILDPADRLDAARRVLAGVDAAGRRLYDGMDAAGVISLAHGNGTRRPHPSVLAAAVGACGGGGGWSFDDYHAGRGFAPLEAAVRRDLAASAPPGFARDAAVCVAAGTGQVVSAFLAARARPGDALLIVRPHYHGVIDWCAAAGVRPVVVRAGAGTAYRGDAADLDEALARAGGARACGVLVANPTFTGAVYAPRELSAIGAWAAARGATLLVDTAFRRTEYGGRPPAAVCGEAGDAERVLVIGGVSKAYNLANVRVAWAAGGASTVGAIERCRERTMGAVPFIAQAMAAAALGAPRAYLRANAAECKARCEVVRAWVESTNAALGTEALRVVHRPEAGHAILLSADGLAGRVSTSLALCRLLLERHRVAVSPAYSHGFDGLEFRVSFGSVGLASTYAASAEAERRAMASAGAAAPAAAVEAGESPEAMFGEGRRRLRDGLARVAAGVGAMLGRGGAGGCAAGRTRPASGPAK